MRTIGVRVKGGGSGGGGDSELHPCFVFAKRYTNSPLPSNETRNTIALSIFGVVINAFECFKFG